MGLGSLKNVFLFCVVGPSIYLKCDQGDQGDRGGFPAEVFHYKASSALSLSLQHLGCGKAVMWSFLWSRLRRHSGFSEEMIQ